MKKYSKRRKGIACLALTVFLTTAGFLPTGEAFAADTVTNMDQLIQQARTKASDNAIAQFRQEVPRYANVMLRGTIYPQSENYVLENTVVKQKGEPTITYDDTIYIGHSTLHNKSNVDQTMTTQSFSQTTTDSISTSTTHAIGTSATASSSFQIPFVGEAGLAFTASYDFNNTSTNESSKSMTIAVEPQRVTVPANSSIEVNVYLTKAKIEGDVELHGRLKGSESGYVNIQANNVFWGWIFASDKSYSFDINEVIKNNSNEFGVTPNADGSINVLGQGTYSASVGADLVVETKNLSTGETATTTLPGTAVGDRDGQYPTKINYASTKVIDSSGSSSEEAEQKVTLFKDDNYHGSSQQLGVGRYNYWDFSMIGNDNLSSLYVPNGYKVTLFADCNFSGESRVYTSNADLYLENFNDRVSSIIIQKIA